MTGPATATAVRGRLPANADGPRVGPLRAVLDALTAGVPTLAAVGTRTGLDPSVVAAAVDQLVRSGRVAATEIPLGCPASCPALAGRGGCPVTAGVGGCAAPDDAPGHAPGHAPRHRSPAGPRGRTMLAFTVLT